MINISQHSFVPRTKIQQGKIYNYNAQLKDSPANDTFEPQLRFGLNTVYFPQNFPTFKLAYKVTYFDPFAPGGNNEIPENRVVVLPRESERIAFGNNYSLYPDLPRGMVFQIGFYQPQPAVLGVLSMPDVQITDIIEESI